MGTRPQHNHAYRRLCRFLAEKRAEADLTHRALALVLRKPHSYVYKVEHGERRIDPMEFIAWCRACSADPADAIRALERSRGQ